MKIKYLAIVFPFQKNKQTDKNRIVRTKKNTNRRGSGKKMKKPYFIPGTKNQMSSLMIKPPAAVQINAL